jgi:hypothetical protein
MEFPKTSTLIPDKKYVITFDGLVFVGLYISSDKKHHFEEPFNKQILYPDLLFIDRCIGCKPDG